MSTPIPLSEPTSTGSERPRDIDLERALLFYFLFSFSSVTSWRIRRVDRFTATDWATYEAKHLLDLVVDAQVVKEVSQALDECSPDSGLLEPDSETVADSCELSRPHNPWVNGQRLRLLMPIAWLAGPLLGFSVRQDARELVPLSRRETADVLQAGFVPILVAAQQHGVFDDPASRITFDRLRHLTWMIAATDMAGFRTDAQLSRIRNGAVDDTNNIRSCCSWLAAQMDLAGMDADAASELLRSRGDGLTSIAHGAEMNRGIVDGRTARWFVDRSMPGAANACINPLLTYKSFCRLATHASKGLPNGYLQSTEHMDYFLSLCADWNSIVQSLATRASSGHKDSAQLLGLLFKIGQSWPVICRMDVTIGEHCRVEVERTNVLDRKKKRSSWAGSLPLVAAIAIRIILSYFWWFWGWVSFIHDAAQIRVGGRGTWFCERNSQGYALALRDAQSYHVEIACNRAESFLVPRASFVKWRELNVPNEHVAEQFRKCRRKRWVFGRQVRTPSTEVFGRCSDGGTRVHHFYTTRTYSDNPRTLAPGRRLAGVSEPQLVVRYGMNRWMAWANIITVVASVSMGVILARAAFLYPSTFSDLLPIAVPLYVGGLLLFAYEKHADALVAARLQKTAYLVIGSTVVAVCAAGVACLSQAPQYLPDVPGKARLRFLDAGNEFAGWYSTNEHTVVALLFVVTAVLVTGSLAVLAAWWLNWDQLVHEKDPC